MSFDKLRDYIIITFFLGSIIAPNIVMLVIPQHENNKFTNFKSFPELTLKNPVKSVKLFRRYYLENFGFKNELVKSYLGFKKNYISENPLPDRVIKGKENWYFLGNHYDNVVLESFGMTSISENDLYSIEKNLLKINGFFQKKGIDFYVVIPPNKNSIYQEKLPFNISQHLKPIDQLKQLFAKHDDLSLIDLTDALTRAKDSLLLYHRTDSHWNDFGAYLGYSEVVNQLDKKYKISKIFPPSYDLKAEVMIGDIVNMIAVEEKENVLKYKKRDDTNVSAVQEGYSFSKYQKADKPFKLLMYRDSFANNWIKFFNETFGETIFLRDYTIKETIIEKENPDIVILEAAERNIDIILKNIKFVN